MKIGRGTSVATTLTILSMRAGMLGDDWRYMSALEWARRIRG